VLTRSYATQIAREWNTQDDTSGFAGFVTQFEVSDAYVRHYAVQSVGDRSHREYWIPAADLEKFNDHISGRIEVVEHFTSDSFVLEIDPTTHLPLELDRLMQEHDGARVWSVWRQDDNGNRFLVRSGITEEEAHQLASEFEARGHKQLYWFERQE
jgi:hypothetical protein